MPGTVVSPEETSWPTCAPSSQGSWNAGFRKQIFLDGHGKKRLFLWRCINGRRNIQVPCILISFALAHRDSRFLKDKAHGGPFETPFQHADEAEASYSLSAVS